MVGGYSYEVDGDYVDLVHYYDPESKSIIPLEGRLQTKKGVLYDNSIILIAYFNNSIWYFLGSGCIVGKSIYFPWMQLALDMWNLRMIAFQTWKPILAPELLHSAGADCPPYPSFLRREWVNRGKSCRSHILDCYAPPLPFPRSSFRFSLPPISARSVKEEGMSVRPSVVCHIGNQSVCSFASDFFPPVRHFPALLACCRRWSDLA